MNEEDSYIKELVAQNGWNFWKRKTLKDMEKLRADLKMLNLMEEIKNS